MTQALLEGLDREKALWFAEQASEVPRASSSEDLSDDANSLFETDEFRMYCYKVLPCAKRQVHDWTTCCFAHPGEKARRRDPRVYKYLAIPCPEVKQNQPCPRGESCQYCHSVFEYWLHPSRYRTQLCQNGSKCRRSVCFFAHSVSDLRVPDHSHLNIPEELVAENAAKAADNSVARANDTATTISGMLPQIDAPVSPASPPTPSFSTMGQVGSAACSRGFSGPLRSCSGMETAFDALFCSESDQQVPEPTSSSGHTSSRTSLELRSSGSPPLSPAGSLSPTASGLPSFSSALLQQQQQACTAAAVDAAIAAAAQQFQSNVHIGTPAQQSAAAYSMAARGQLSPQSSLSRSTSGMSAYTSGSAGSPPCGYPHHNNYLNSNYGIPSSAPMQRMGSFPSPAAAEMAAPGSNVDVAALLQAISILQQGNSSNNLGMGWAPAASGGFPASYNSSCAYAPEAYPGNFSGKYGQGMAGGASVQGVLQLAQLVETLNKEPSLGNNELLMGLVNRLLGMVGVLMQQPPRGYMA